MAPKQESDLAAANTTIDFLKKAVKRVSGVLDFDAFATDIGASNAEAARKRFKRMFEKDSDPLQIVGSTLGQAKQTKAAQAEKPKSKTKAKSSIDDGELTRTSKVKGSTKKRKLDEVDQDSEQ